MPKTPMPKPHCLSSSALGFPENAQAAIPKSARIAMTRKKIWKERRDMLSAYCPKSCQRPPRIGLLMASTMRNIMAAAKTIVKSSVL